MNTYEPVRIVANCRILENGILIFNCLDGSNGNTESERHISANHILAEVDQID